MAKPNVVPGYYWLCREEIRIRVRVFDWDNDNVMRYKRIDHPGDFPQRISNLPDDTEFIYRKLGE